MIFFIVYDKFYPDVPLEILPSNQLINNQPVLEDS